MATPVPDIIVITHFPSPYQVELFDEIDRQVPGRLKVIYLHQKSTQRQWSSVNLKHRSKFLNLNWANINAVRTLCMQARVVVFNFYDDPRAVLLLNQRAATGKPWCFWGERPGYLSPLLGRLRRLWSLRVLHHFRAPIWGIGRMAVNAYREEFGPHRQYVNLPYFSDLARFRAIGQKKMSQGDKKVERVLLFSGSLIPRKGVDLVADAFAQVATEIPKGRLLIMGAGKLEAVMRKRLRACAGRVEFTGFKDWSVLPEVYAQADVLCVPSRHDGWGLVVPEGLASALPVISTSATGAAVEFVEKGINGWMIPPSDAGALATAMREALTLPDECLRAMSCAAFASVESHQLEAGAARFLVAAEQAVQDW